MVADCLKYFDRQIVAYNFSRRPIKNFKLDNFENWTAESTGKV